MIGKVVGHYKVVGKIGDGGMGSVFEAVHERIGRRVAIKVLRPEFSKDKNLVARFHNEALAVNIVSHPGIVGSIDYGQLDDGAAYIIMEFLEGEPLAKRIKRVKSSLGPDSLRIVRQLASTLSAAHAKGIIHRDLKPDNIMMVPDSEAPGGERAKILDFGIAKIAAEQAENQQAAGLTQVGAVMGTPRYMSPEQCRGAGKVDGKTDVYALGIIAFEMLTGRLPFEAEGAGGLMADHMFSPPPAPREIDPGIPVPIESLVLSMLAKDPAQRPTMPEVVARIEALGVQGTSVHAVVRAPQTGQSAPGVQASPYAQSQPRLTPLPLPAPDSSGPTTTSRPSLLGLGQTQDPTRPRLAQSRVRRLVVPILTAVLLSGVGLFVLSKKLNPTPTPVTAPPKKRTVRWRINTSPPGVQVFRASDGNLLGLTPYASTQTASHGTVAMSLRMTGYESKSLSMDLERDCSETISLDPVAAPPSPEPDKPPPTPPGKSGKPSTKSTKKKDDNPFAPVR